MFLHNYRSYIGFIILIIIGCDNTPEKTYSALIKEHCKNADIIEIEKKADYVEIEYLCDGKVYEEVINTNNQVVFTEVEANTEDLPEKVFKKIHKKYPGWAIDECNEVYVNDTMLYKVELVKDGMEQNAYFTISGKVFKLNEILEAEKWNSIIVSSNTNFSKAPYDLLHPNTAYDLPDVLREVSGIAALNTTQVYCIQDELGAVFRYNLKEEIIEKSYRFTDKGDFEGLTTSGNRIFALRSDGLYYTFTTRGFPDKVISKNLPFQSLNIEGIFHNEINNSLLFACRENDIDEPPYIKNIYRYALDSNHNQLENIIKINSQILEKAIKKAFPEIKAYSVNFAPSDIAVHPKTGDYYILSATDRLLVIYDANGKFKQVYPLPCDVFYKPEGINFLSDGTMLISNEGTKNGMIKASILLFEYKQ